MKRKRIALLFGGESGEHTVSIRSSRFIFHTLDRSKYEVVPVYWSDSGVFYLPNPISARFPAEEFETGEDFLSLFLNQNPGYRKATPAEFALDSWDAVFLGLHGGAGEDGRIQGFLEVCNLPYTGSGVLGSALAMDKKRANELFEKAKVPVAPFKEIINNKDLSVDELQDLPYPIFVKPTLGGSSVNTGIANNPEEAKKILEKIFTSDDRALLQKLIKGTEVSIGVLESFAGGMRKLFPLVPTEIRPKSNFFDFEAKYKKGGSEEITPAPLPENVTKRLQEYALICHQTLHCRGYSRTDFIIQDGIPFVLETNTLPGMTGTSLIPQQAEALGISMSDVFDWLLEIALSSAKSIKRTP